MFLTNNIWYWNNGNAIIFPVPVFKYQFKFPDISERPINYKLNLNEKTFKLVKINDEKTPPDWAKLDFNKCSNCTFKEDSTAYCPIAKNLHSVVNFFKDQPSFKEATVFLETEQRSYAKKCSIQEGLFSIFGIIMATSGCPHMDFLAPMVRFHLPFATFEETFFRVASTYLLHQYILKMKQKIKGEISLDGLLEKYKQVEVVNHGMLARINSIAQKDADKNALIILNNFAQIIRTELESNELETLSKFF